MRLTVSVIMSRLILMTYKYPFQFFLEVPQDHSKELECQKSRDRNRRIDSKIANDFILTRRTSLTQSCNVNVNFNIYLVSSILYSISHN